MRQLTTMILDALNPEEPDEWQRIDLGHGFSASRDPYAHIYPIFADESTTMVAAALNGMLHESLILFRPGLEDLLELAGIHDGDGYQLDSTERAYPDPPLPPAAVWLKRMPGWFATSSELRNVPTRVSPDDGDPFAAPTTDAQDFTHAIYDLERAVKHGATSGRDGEPIWVLPTL